MPTTITLKNIPDDLYERIKAAAGLERRSINSQIIISLEQAFLPRQVDLAEHLAKARLLREKTAHYVLDDAEIEAAKQTGRE